MLMVTLKVRRKQGGLIYIIIIFFSMIGGDFEGEGQKRGPDLYFFFQ